MNKDELLYEILSNNSNTYLTQQEVWERLNGVLWDKTDTPFHDSHERMLLTKQINRLNRSYDFNGLILSTSKGIKLATEEEAIKAVKSIYATALKKLKYARELETKINRDGQFDIEFKEYKFFIDKEN